MAKPDQDVRRRHHRSRLRPLLHQTRQRRLLRLPLQQCRNYFCGLQQMKPEACKLWPFKVLSEPKYGEPSQAVFDYMGNRLYVYADTMCSGLRYGTPTWDFRYTTIREFTELALGLRQVQYKTTRAVAPRPEPMGQTAVPLKVSKSATFPNLSFEGLSYLGGSSLYQKHSNS